MNNISILATGSSDCIVITAGAPDGRKTIVMDGATKEYNGKPVLLEHLRRNGIAQIDLLIVTHLHQDHHGGFTNLIGEIAIKKAILPYGDIVLSAFMNEHYKSSWHYVHYHEMYAYLASQNTEIRQITDCCGETFGYGDISLKCLYPRKASDLTIPAILPAMCDDSLDAEAAMDVYLKFKDEHINSESSIWLLSCNGKNIAFLPGDSIAAIQKSVLEEVGGAPDILKMTHHGLKFKRVEYFNEELINALNPKHVVVTNDLVREKYAASAEDCADACRGIGVTPYFTLNGPFSYDF